jgi:hypothetical protein
VKRAPAGLEWAPVASGAGEEAGVGAGYVGAAPASSGTMTEAPTTLAASGRVGEGGRSLAPSRAAGGGSRRWRHGRLLLE